MAWDSGRTWSYPYAMVTFKVPQISSPTRTNTTWRFMRTPLGTKTDIWLGITVKIPLMNMKHFWTFQLTVISQIFQLPWKNSWTWNIPHQQLLPRLALLATRLAYTGVGFLCFLLFLLHCSPTWLSNMLEESQCTYLCNSRSLVEKCPLFNHVRSPIYPY